MLNFLNFMKFNLPAISVYSLLVNQLIMSIKYVLLKILFSILLFMTVSCKTCKCPAYSMHEPKKSNIPGTSKDMNILFDKRLADAKTCINRSI